MTVGPEFIFLPAETIQEVYTAAGQLAVVAANLTLQEDAIWYMGAEIQTHLKHEPVAGRQGNWRMPYAQTATLYTTAMLYDALTPAHPDAVAQLGSVHFDLEAANTELPIMGIDYELRSNSISRRVRQLGPRTEPNDLARTTLLSSLTIRPEAAGKTKEDGDQAVDMLEAQGLVRLIQIVVKKGRAER
jgi:hypothetical protein